MNRPGITSIAIVGAKGQMGNLFSGKFSALGCSVTPINRPLTDEAIQAALTGCDLLLLSVPVTAMDAVLDRVLPFLAPPTILCDVGSVKMLPMKAMLDRYDGPVVGTHPLFGPVIPAGFEPKVAVVPGRDTDRAAADAVSALFAACGYSCFDSTAEEHDRAMAIVQGLNFTSTVAFLAAARDVDSIENYVTPSFRRRLDSAHKMLTMDTELFEVISEANPFLQETNRKFMSYLSLAAGGDLDLLAERAQWWWRNESY
ncbi:MAG: prephenate dehydrogenase [Pseudodesulfovibrio sp.]|uniref:Prephenate dehydrogenase n=1 Tax=Pseudodesulfovibrio aespoeensis (strain ATCC 700646 / DSM 10631 / Aspo-2) TaxID=643562 RepID=E6VSI4_PSEA9|nr:MULTISPECIES: prephenate dehydrogenase [Pseudodesulfovibrio]MBU4192964.1 prephenate dehydrogenase [Pseudomonadota bacterium]ADU61969.1 Prephenate dehydrogenase [Pseudodesulfovibrio aespoeensis Aspo-2]MBU4242826.1 prephenate dehydrogenase [Pseudomonadota bacterium]MBU4380123.1 prephenate dehydrogenase [Pseudomonadota bacterium]MBU4476809.1 prephenate dehydrogenase [Pseudomonadota bacterium]